MANYSFRRHAAASRARPANLDVKIIWERMRKLIEGVLLLVSLVLAVKWELNPAGPYEPLIALAGIVIAGIDFLVRIFAKGPPLEVAPIEQRRPTEQRPTVELVTTGPELPTYSWSSDSEFFAERFQSAFPGVRETTWFNGQEAVERLAHLLKPPLIFKTSDNGERRPIWWVGRGNLHIASFKQLDGKTVLVNCKEYKISRLAAVYSSSYKRLWVYVETEPMPATGLYANTPQHLAKAQREGETYAEEYAIYAGRHKVTRAEYDDGHALIFGKLTEIYRDCELRVRQLTPYNFAICPHDSPINNLQFDGEHVSLLDDALKDPNGFQVLEARIRELPPSREH